MVSVGANFTRALWEMVEGEAGKHGIPCQRTGVPSRSSTDAWAIPVERGGTICGLISMPNRYMHSPNEVISLTDLENLGKLMAATVKVLDECDLRHTIEVFRQKLLSHELPEPPEVAYEEQGGVEPEAG